MHIILISFRHGVVYFPKDKPIKTYTLARKKRKSLETGCVGAARAA